MQVVTELRPYRDALLADVVELIDVDDDIGVPSSAVVEAVVDALVDLSVLVLPDRWDEECHACERRVGDHLLDGRCP